MIGLVGALALVPILVNTGSAAHADPKMAPTFAKRITGYLSARDGTLLHYSVLLPATTGRFPAIVNYSGYDAGSIGGDAYLRGETAMSAHIDTMLLKAGYAVVGVNMAGTGCSAGSFQLFDPRWGTDGYDAVEWIAKQSWSNGAVGMNNWSYAGLSQLFTASTRPPHLKAIAPGMAVADPWRDVGFPGGVENTGFPLNWWLFIQVQWTHALWTALAEGDLRCQLNIASHVALSQTSSPAAELTKDPFPEDHPEGLLINRLGNISIPVLSMVSWQDEATGPRAGYYQNLLNPATTYLVGTNGQHDNYVSNRFQALALRFFDRYVKGIPNGLESTPHVQLWEDSSAPGAPLTDDSGMEDLNPAEIITRRSLPVQVTPLPLYLRDNGVLGATTMSSTGGDTFSYPTPGPKVNADLSSGNKEWAGKAPTGTLAYTTRPLSNALTFYGSGSLDLWVRSSVPDADLQATITEVRPDGMEEYVGRGWLRLSQRALDPGRSTSLLPYLTFTRATTAAMPIGQAEPVRLELQQFSHVFRAGSSIRVWIDSPSETGEWSFSSPTNQGTIQVLHDPAHPSRLVLGLLQQGGISSGFPACDTVLSEPCRINPVPVPR